MFRAAGERVSAIARSNDNPDMKVRAFIEAIVIGGGAPSALSVDDAARACRRWPASRPSNDCPAPGDAPHADGDPRGGRRARAIPAGQSAVRLHDDDRSVDLLLCERACPQPHRAGRTGRLRGIRICSRSSHTCRAPCSPFCARRCGRAGCATAEAVMVVSSIHRLRLSGGWPSLRPSRWRTMQGRTDGSRAGFRLRRGNRGTARTRDRRPGARARLRRRRSRERG